MSIVTNTSNWPNLKGLRIGHLNVCHLINKLFDVSMLLNNNGAPFQIFGFTETWTNQCMSNSDLYIPGYDLIRQDFQAKINNGIAIYVQNNLTFKLRTDLSHVNVECIWLEVFPCKFSSFSLLIGFLYRNPKANAAWYTHFEDMLSNVWLSGKEIVFMGDFNINLFNGNANWLSFIDLFNLHQCISLPTRINFTSCTLIDHIYSNDPTHLTEICVPSCGISDHNPICVTWNKRGIKQCNPNHTVISFRSYKHFDLSSFHEDLASAPFSNIYNFTNPDDALSFFTEIYCRIVDIHIPIIKRRVKSKIKPDWLTKQILDEMKIRDSLQKGTDAFRKQRNLVQYLQRKSKKDWFRNLIQDKKNSKAIWSAINIHKKHNRPSLPLSLTSNMFNNHFGNITQSLLSSKINTGFDGSLLKTFCAKKNVSQSFMFPLLSVQEVHKYLLTLKISNSSGYDGISSKIIKLSLPYIVDPLTFIYNLCLSHSHFPSVFKHAKVIPLFKKGDKNDVNNYRPISLLSTLSKPLARHMCNSMSRYIEHKNLLHTNQSGFRKNHSCETALCQLTDSWLRHINNGRIIGSVFIDFTKAFDMVNHEVLLNKLEIYGFHSSCLDLFKSYLSNRSQSVLAHGELSSPINISRGVPQGSILGPILFSLYINDLPLYIAPTTCELFADDTSIHHASNDIKKIEINLNKSMINIKDWCNSNDMVLHPAKTKCMLISSRQKRTSLKQLSNLNVVYDSAFIEQVQHHKVLGVTIDENLLWREHVHETTKKLSQSIFQLSKIKKFLDENSRKIFYHAFIQSRIDYCSTIWSNCSASVLKRLASLQKRCIKLVSSNKIQSSEFLFKYLNIMPLKQRFRYKLSCLMYKIAHGTAPGNLNSLFSFGPSRLRKRAKYPRPKLNLFKCSFSFSGATVWNSIPYIFRELVSFDKFRLLMKSFVFDTHD